MQVLEHGNTYNKIECPNCHCKFEYVGKDIDRKQTGKAKGQGFNIKREFIESILYCPECGAWITINKERNSFFDVEN